MYATYKKHRLAIILIIMAALIMSCALICGTQGIAYAADDGNGGVANVKVGETVKPYNSFSDAWSAAKNAGTATITLLDSVTADNTLTVDKGKNITLDLNGNTLFGSYDNVIVVKGTFTLKDEKNKGEITFTTSHYDKNKSAIGGGVCVQGGTFIMEGGNIRGNYAYGGIGGGVLVGADYGNDDDDGGLSECSGTFIMEGGSITGNTASDNGAGVYIYSGTFEVSGAVNITGNTVNGSENNVYLKKGTITVTGALEKDGNKAQIGVYNIDKQFTSDYSKNCKDENGVLIAPSTYFISDKTDYVPVSLSADEAIEVEFVKGNVTVQKGNGITAYTGIGGDSSGAWHDANSASAATIKLFADVTTANTLTVNSGINLDLNGKMLKYNGSENHSVITVAGGNFTLDDSEKDLPEDQKTQHKYYVSTDEDTKGLWIFDENGTEILYGGVLTGGKGEYESGWDGSSIGLFGGGAYVKTNSVFTMTGGTIAGNMADQGGGVCVSDNGWLNGDFIMNDGMIAGNKASGLGGGVHVNGGTFTMTGGVITENAGYGASMNGSGSSEDYFATQFRVSGAPKITGNNSVRFTWDDSNSIYIDGTLTEGAEIVISNTGAVATGYAQDNDPSEFFIPADSTNDCIYASEVGTVYIGTHNFVWEHDDDYHQQVCSNCDESTDEAVHVYNQEVVSEDYFKSAATCAAKAVYYKSCVCGAHGTETFEYGDVDGTNHNAATAWSIDTESGTHYHACENGCGEKFDEAAHNYNQEVASGDYLKSDATCTAKAVYYKSCVCGAHGEDTFEYGEFAAHTPDEAVRENVADSTCSATGSYDEVVYCSVCGEKLSTTPRTIEINPNAHSFGQWQPESPANCTDTGTKAHKDCGLCHKHFDGENAEISDLTIATNNNHTWDNGKVTTQPTCKDQGVRTFTCIHNSVHTKTEYITALGHDYATEFTVDIEATCTMAGSKSKHCSRCDSKSDVTVIDALGHNLVHHGEHEATCEAIGWEAYDTCSRCAYTTYSEINALGHNYETEFTVDIEATCTTAGSKSKHCSRCDSKSDVTVIDALGHEYGEWTVVKEATVDEEGEERRVCVHDATHYESRSIAKLSVPESKNELSAGAIAGISIGVIILILLIAYVLCYFLVYRRGIVEGKAWDAIYLPMNAIFGKKENDEQEGER